MIADLIFEDRVVVSEKRIGKCTTHRQVWRPKTVWQKVLMRVVGLTLLYLILTGLTVVGIVSFKLWLGVVEWLI